MSFFGFLQHTPPLTETGNTPEKEGIITKPENPIHEEPVINEEVKDEVEQVQEEQDENRAPAADEPVEIIFVEEEEEDEEEEMQKEEAEPQLEEEVEGNDKAPLEEKEVPSSPVSRLECDYDLDPTKLYEALQLRNWDAAVDRCKEADYEARTWVSRKEKDGKLRWRLLPLHAAIIFKAPEIVVEALLAAYPKAAESKDDQGMLPIHLAFRSGSSEGIVDILLAAYPQSVEVKDRKGRIPLVLAQACTSPNRESFMRALERGPSYYAVAAAATERAAVRAEQQALFDVKLQEINEAHAQKIEMIRLNYEQSVIDKNERIAELESELLKTKETSQVLVDHVNMLEAQLSSRTDTERFLASRIATLDSSLKITTKDKEDLESNLKTVNETLLADKQRLETDLATLQESHRAQAAALVKAVESLAKMEEDYKLESSKQEATMHTLEKEWAAAKASEAILQAQLKKRIQSEQGLAKEVSFLAARLSESAAESHRSVDAYGHRVRNVEKERNELRSTVKALTLKLETVKHQLDQVLTSQAKLVETAAIHDGNMVELASIQDQLLEHTKRHHDLYDKASQEYQEFFSILEARKVEAEQHAQERKSILLAFEMQNEQMEYSQKERKQLMAKVEKQQLEIKHLIANELSRLPFVAKGEEDFVDTVVKHVLTEEFDAEAWHAAKSVKTEESSDLEEARTRSHEEVVQEESNSKEKIVEESNPKEVVHEEAVVSEEILKEECVQEEEAADKVFASEKASPDPPASDEVVQDESWAETTSEM